MNSITSIKVFLGLSTLLALSSISAMQITDSTGQKKALTQEQSALLQECQTFGHLTASFEGELDYEGKNPFITVANSELLASIINNLAHLNTIKDDQQCIDLFKLANYWKAPQNILTALAERLYKPIKAQREALQKEKNNLGPESDQKLSELDYLYDELLNQLPYYPDFNTFLADYGQKIGDSFIGLGNGKTDDIEEFMDRAGWYLVDNQHILHLGSNYLQKKYGVRKKIASLDGIEDCLQYPWANRITHLCLDDHLFATFSIKKLKTIFPQLRVISLQGNQITKIGSQEIDADIKRLYLNNNQISSITIENPHHFNGMLIKVAGNPIDPATDFFCTPTRIQRSANWLQAFGAQSKTVIKSPDIKALKTMFISGYAALRPLLFIIDCYKHGRAHKFGLLNLKMECTVPFVLGLEFYLLDLMIKWYNGRLNQLLQSKATGNPYSIKIEGDSKIWGAPSFDAYPLR